MTEKRRHAPDIPPRCLWVPEMDISVIIPAYHEAENLKWLLPELRGILNGTGTAWEILVVDAQRLADESAAVCADNGAVYLVQPGQGYGDAFRAGIRAVQGRATVVVDADGSQDIRLLPEMYRQFVAGSDVVIGSRYVAGGRTEDRVVSVLMSRALNGTYRLLLGLREHDLSTDFRLYDTRMLRQIRTECQNFDVIEETLFLLHRAFPQIRVTELPIVYRTRREGFSKRKLLRFIGDYLRLLFRLIKIKRRS